MYLPMTTKRLARPILPERHRPRASSAETTVSYHSDAEAIETIWL